MSNQLSFVGAGNLRKKTMAGIRSSYPASFFLTVQSQGVRGKIIAPECFLEFNLQFSSLVFKRVRALHIAKKPADYRARALGSVHVALDFTQGDGRFRQLSVGIKNGI